MATKPSPSPKPNKNAMGPMKTKPAKVEVGGTGNVRRSAAEKTIGVNGIGVKYFTTKFALEKDPKNPQLQRQLIDRERTLARAHNIMQREFMKESKAAAKKLTK
jgi:hypothetical protein